MRHGESAWNLAQSNRDLQGLLENKDAPLSAEGVQQCQALREKIGRCE